LFGEPLNVLSVSGGNDDHLSRTSLVTQENNPDEEPEESETDEQELGTHRLSYL
jgi:hypothetical protein